MRTNMKKRFRVLRDLGAPRIFLHASKLTFTHPQTGERISVPAPLPGDLATVLDHLA